MTVMKRQGAARKPQPPRVTLAAAVVANGQRLRAGETANWATFLVAFSAARRAS
jgi:hypothetical protein